MKFCHNDCHCEEERFSATTKQSVFEIASLAMTNYSITFAFLSKSKAAEKGWIKNRQDT